MVAAQPLGFHDAQPLGAANANIFLLDFSAGNLQDRRGCIAVYGKVYRQSTEFCSLSGVSPLYLVKTSFVSAVNLSYGEIREAKAKQQEQSGGGVGADYCKYLTMIC